MSRRRSLPRRFEELAGLRARGLVRESTVAQGENSGPIVQLRDQVEFARRWGLNFDTGPDGEPFTYTDLVSGSDAAKRPQFQRMVSDAEAGAFDVLLVRETSRFARNWRQAGGYEDRLHQAGIVIAYIYEGRLSTDRAGQLQLVVNHAINEEYREKLADNVQRGYRVKRFEAGKFSGTPPIGYVMEYVDATVDGAKGYERQETGRLLPDGRPRPRIGHGTTYTNADLARTIGELYASGRFGTRALAAHLNLEGYRTARGEPFTGNALRHMLESPTYAGYLSWHHRADKRALGEPGEVVRGAWEPLWSESLWLQIQNVRARNFRGSAGGRATFVYPFRRIAVCDRCDRRLIGEGHRVAGGVLAGYMVCSTQRERHECQQRGVRSADLEDQVGQWLATVEVPEDWKEDLERLASRTRRKESERSLLDRTAIENQRRRLVDMYLEVQIGREEYVGRMRALEASLSGGLEQPSYFEADLVKIKGLLHDWKTLWDKATPEERQDIVGALFGEVRVRDKNIVSATLADPSYAPLIASSEARRLQLVETAEDGIEQVGLAPPDGFEPPTRSLGRCRSIH